MKNQEKKIKHGLMSPTGEVEVTIKKGESPEMEKKPIDPVITKETVQDVEKQITSEQSRSISYSRQQLDQIKDVYAKGANDVEFSNFVMVSVRTGLDIFKKHIYLVPRYDSKLERNIYAPQCSIDGFRAIAEDSQVYAGSDDVIFEGTTGTKGEYPEKATITVYKMVQGQRCAFTASARWTEYYPGDKIGFMWKQKPHIMLGKCAEALALRKAFPAKLNGLYTEDEMKYQDVTFKVVDEKKLETMFDKAKGIVMKKTNVDILLKDRENMEKSEKYNADQKKEIIEIIDKRIEELTTGHDK